MSTPGIPDVVGSGGITAPASVLQPASSPVMQRVRAYFAPVNRATSTPVMFDAATAGQFQPSAPPAPWIDLGWVSGFERTSGSTIAQMSAGVPAAVQTQMRGKLDATVQLRFQSWGKLQMALACSSEQMNVLAESNGVAVAAVKTASGSTATSLVMASGTFNTGDILAVDADYSTQTGFLGTGASCAYVPAGAQIADVDYIRRMTLNVARVVSVQGNVLTLASPLLGGAPAGGLGVQKVVAFQDREGGTFFQEWSALFVMQGVQGDAIFLHYPRLQATKPTSERQSELADTLTMMEQQAYFRALPVTDGRDGATALCYRTYVPASMMAIG